ncbi:hypothetical protein J437_LFUL012865 [Ladona fulva]|uniref:C2H2-type domain-containing protein n=1 Tax=Ladona fulva TaxID=123851 RepID=A0A8K0KCL4_LADFU|nr:hypothetical protein J437_LFUL012865 [Ladona fulva]
MKSNTNTLKIILPPNKINANHQESSEEEESYENDEYDDEEGENELIPCTCGIFLAQQCRGKSKDPSGEPVVQHCYEKVMEPEGMVGIRLCSNKCVEMITGYLANSNEIICALAGRDVNGEKAHLYVKNHDDKWHDSNLSSGKFYCKNEPTSFPEMCHPPLVCPLCSSAGGFPSPGALWLGLIGVANRLLSCPVCHELLLGLDKLTIHLVSHVPDLNLLASAIGSFVTSNQKFAHEFGKTDIRGARRLPENLSENTSQTVFSSSEGNNISYDRTPIFYKRVENSELKSTATVCGPKSSEQKQLPIHKEQYYHYSPDQGIQNKPDCFRNINPGSHHRNMRESCTQTSQDLDIAKNSFEDFNKKVKAASPRSDDKFLSRSQMKPCNNKLLPQTTGQNSGLNALITLTGKESIAIAHNQFTSSETNSTSKALHRSNTVLSPDKLYRPQEAKGTLGKENALVVEHFEDNERSTNVLEDKIAKCDGRTTLYQCIECNAVFDDHRCLFLHCMAFHQNSDPLQSLICQTTLPESEMNFPCQLCNRKLVSKGELLVHMRFAHSVAPQISAEDEYEKLKEDSAANSTDDLSKALDTSSSQADITQNTSPLNIKINIHGGIEEKTPETLQGKEITDYLAERQNSLKDNPTEIEAENSQDTSKDDYSNGSPPQQCQVDEETKQSCKICEAQFSSVIELIAHRPAHSEEDGCICVVCGKSFKKEQHLQQHLRTHEGKQWECDVCSKLFTTKYFLKKHKRLHTGEMPYSCETCGKTFTFQQSYHKHLLYHSDEKPHACAECGKRFKELSTLHNHERIHTGEKPFSCESCGKAFRQRVSYLVHRRIHTGVMPYKCTVCEKSFRYKVSQRTHKCSSQQTGTVVRQSSDLVERLLSHQRDKPATSVCSSRNELHLSISEKDCLSNQSGCSSQHSTEALQEIPTTSQATNVNNDKNINSFALFSSNFETFTANLTNMDAQNKSNPFSTPSEDRGIQDQRSNKRSVSSPIHKNPKDGRTKECPADFCSQILNEESKVKILDSQTHHIKDKQFDATELESTSQHSSDSGRASYTMQPGVKNENHHDMALRNEESSENRNEIRVIASTMGNEIFNTTLFSSNNDMLDPVETDFFTMVMSPAEPTLEQMGKLTISSMPSPPENIKLGMIESGKTHGDQNEEIILKIHLPVTPVTKNQNNEDHDDNSKSIPREENLASSIEHETTNASDLSSFLQSCFDHWTSSSIVSLEKSKEISTTQSDAKHNQCLSAAEDNRLQTINEESLKNLLYGDHLQ